VLDMLVTTLRAPELLFLVLSANPFRDPRILEQLAATSTKLASLDLRGCGYLRYRPPAIASVVTLS